MIGVEFMMLCAPNVAPQTIEQIIHVESRGNELAININGAKLPRKPTDAADAAKIAREYMAKGYSVDLGLMQVNSRNLASLGYTVEDMFEPCKNIAAGGRVLTAFYTSARPKYPDDQSALRAALSAYNTGNFEKGFTNGYLARYGVGAPVALARVPALNPYTADTAVFVRQLQQQKEQAMSNQAQQQTAQASTTVRANPVVSTSQEDMATPGVQVEYTADQAEANGAFRETALSEGDAWAANADLAADPNGTAIVVGRKPVRQAAERKPEGQ
ncbi:lytic transglycosylase domain-containing protein [Salmonella enterica subsp. enterica serovar Heidelberg]|nr:lytic transglycosylase [Salmonella enterica subsp. enterica serovar Heidelberg]EEK2418831.1 lytic transglycosylase domain-containing protein [Salmonella enterica subsp. enterica serovar Heidelberg]EGC9888849.1 lytic transglycosylase domain-containing protein [Salmonella enterica]